MEKALIAASLLCSVFSISVQRLSQRTMFGMEGGNLALRYPMSQPAVRLSALRCLIKQASLIQAN
jgi:hypothetical protein